ncbi:hypothetical protein B0H16DRAFT_1272296, partial [Mycena metata]
VSLDNWRRYKRDGYLSKLLHSHAPRGNDADGSPCPGCSNKPRQFRCRQCFGGILYCRDCVLQRHRENPLHRLEYWNGRFFVKVSMAMLGLRIQMGHPPDSPCPTPERGPTGFVVLHTNGIHEVTVDFCGCEHAFDAGPHEQQSL